MMLISIIFATLISRVAWSQLYTFEFPLPEDYRISILMDPCRLLAYNCCSNVFGVGEYPSLRSTGLEKKRAHNVTVIGSDTEVAINYDLVYEDSSSVLISSQRSADDETIFNSTCKSKGFDIYGQPATYCAGRNFGFRRSNYRPPCSDNNFSLNAMASCVNINGASMKNCVQVGYTQNAYIGTCSTPQSECGTFLEIHMLSGSPYNGENDLIAEVALDQYSVSGIYTTTISLNWMKNTSKVLCAYTELLNENHFRPGISVYISSTEKCCCPVQYSTKLRTGAFSCPKGPLGFGVLAAFDDSIEDALQVDVLNRIYPFCHTDRSSPDIQMMSVLDVSSNQYYTRPCDLATNTSDSPIGNSVGSKWSSRDLGQCTFDSTCVLYSNSTCNKDSSTTYSYEGKVGKVISVDNLSVPPLVYVSFNNGRSSVRFFQRDVKMNKAQRSNYELWWVLRTKTKRVVQKRKGFNVTSPQCTFDTTNNRYFPYAIINDNNMAIDQISS